jgi:hypothetical protein
MRNRHITSHAGDVHDEDVEADEHSCSELQVAEYGGVAGRIESATGERVSAGRPSIVTKEASVTDPACGRASSDLRIPPVHRTPRAHCLPPATRISRASTPSCARSSDMSSGPTGQRRDWDWFRSPWMGSCVGSETLLVDGVGLCGVGLRGVGLHGGRVLRSQQLLQGLCPHERTPWTAADLATLAGMRRLGAQRACDSDAHVERAPAITTRTPPHRSPSRLPVFPDRTAVRSLWPSSRRRSR